MVANTKTNKKNGTLYFLNNSHVGKIDKKMNIINLSSNKDDNRFTANYKMTRCDCNLGDAILISNYVFHKSGKNLSNNSTKVENKLYFALSFMHKQMVQ